MRLTDRPPSLWQRLLNWVCRRAPPPASPPYDLAPILAELQRLQEEVRALRTALPAPDHRSVIIQRVDHLTVEQLYHIIGRLAVDQLDGTLNVGFSRNLRVHPRLPRPESEPGSTGQQHSPRPRGKKV